MHETGCSGLVYWDDPEMGWGVRREWGSELGTHVHLWLIMSKYGKNHHNIAK